MNVSFTSCFDELLKIAAAEPSSVLSPEEKRKQMLQFAGLGGVMVPAMETLSRKAMEGRWLPKDVPAKRYWPVSVAKGLFWGGVLPTIQHTIARANIAQARQRMAAEKELKSLAPETAHAHPGQEVAIPPPPMKGI